MTSPVTTLRTAFTRGTSATTAATPPAGTTDRYLLPVAVLVALVALVAGWFLLVSPVRSDTAAVRAQAATVATQADILQSRIAALEAQQADLPAQRTALAAAQAALPTTSALPEFLRSIRDLGAATGTSVTALTADTPDSTPVATGGAGVGAVYRLPLTVTATGSYGGLTAFLAALQGELPRAVLVGTVDETAADGGATTLTLTLSAFVAPTAGTTGG